MCTACASGPYLSSGTQFTSEHSVPVSLLNPFLDSISETFTKRAAEVELEMGHLRPAVFDIVARCYRQALKFPALRLTYADTLKRTRFEQLA